MKKITFFVLLILAVLVVACSGAQTANNDAQGFENAVNTAVAETLVASLSQSGPASSDLAEEVGQALSAEEPSDGADEAQSADTASTQPTQAPAVSAFESDTTTAGTTTTDENDFVGSRSNDPRDAASSSSSSSSSDDASSEKPCYSATLVSETIPDGTVFHPGDGFAKRWTLKNTGTCEWGNDMRFVWVAGNTKFRAPQDTKLTSKSILPGETVTVTLEMGAPVEPGLYIALYKIIIEDSGKEVTPYGVWLSVWVDYE